MSGIVDVQVDEQTGRLKVEAPPAWQIVARPKRIAPGHGACPGCGVFPALDQFLRGSRATSSCSTRPAARWS